MQKILGSFKQKIRDIFSTYSYFTNENEMLEVYDKWPFVWNKKRCSVSYDHIEAIYAENLEFAFSLVIFVKDKKRLFLPNTIFENDSFSFKNWEEMIRILAEKCLNFNMNNLEQAKETYEVPFLCWHSEKKVTDIQVIVTQDDISIAWKETGEKYGFDDFLAISKDSKDIY
jgi:hypothetical protein